MRRYYRRIGEVTATAEHKNPGWKVIRLLTAMGRIESLPKKIGRSSFLLMIASGEQHTTGHAVLLISRPVTMMISIKA